MKLTPVTSVDRFVSFDGTTIVRISRSLRALDVYCDPPVVQEKSEVWGVCLDEARDSFREVGQLQDVLMSVATQPMVVAAAIASPRRFAEMVAAAHDLGFVFYAASRAIWSVADHVADAKRFCCIEVNEQLLKFHTLPPRNVFVAQREPPGIYSICYSLSDFEIQTRVLVEEHPRPSRAVP